MNITLIAAIAVAIIAAVIFLAICQVASCARLILKELKRTNALLEAIASGGEDE